MIKNYKIAFIVLISINTQYIKTETTDTKTISPQTSQMLNGMLDTIKTQMTFAEIPLKLLKTQLQEELKNAQNGNALTEKLQKKIKELQRQQGRLSKLRKEVEALQKQIADLKLPKPGKYRSQTKSAEQIAQINKERAEIIEQLKKKAKTRGSDSELVSILEIQREELIALLDNQRSELVEMLKSDSSDKEEMVEFLEEQRKTLSEMLQGQRQELLELLRA